MDTPTQTKLAVIYMLLNTVNGKRYIGFTTNLKRRLDSHLFRAKEGEFDYILCNAIRKHGWDAFQCSILAETDDAEYAKNVLEPQFIRKYETFHELGKGYNMTHGGEGTLGYKRTPEQCAAMSARLKGKPFSPERCARISEQTRGENNPNYGKKASPETRAKISAGIRQARAEGRGHYEMTPEHREAISKAHKGKQFSAERREQMSQARLGKPGRPHTEEHKLYMSQILKGRVVSQETRELSRLAHSTHLYTVRSPEGVVYLTVSLNSFAEAFNLSASVLKRSLITGPCKKLKSRTLGWQALTQIPLSDEMRALFAQDLSTCWRKQAP